MTQLMALHFGIHPPAAAAQHDELISQQYSCCPAGAIALTQDSEHLCCIAEHREEEVHLLDLQQLHRALRRDPA